MNCKGLIEEDVPRGGGVACVCNWSQVGAYAADGSRRVVNVRVHDGAEMSDDLKARISAYHALIVDEAARREAAKALTAGTCEVIVGFTTAGDVTDLGDGMFEAPGLEMKICGQPEEVAGTRLCADHKDVWAK